LRLCKNIVECASSSHKRELKHEDTKTEVHLQYMYPEIYGYTSLTQFFFFVKDIFSVDDCVHIKESN
jgi:hypothetical protein